MPKSPDDRLAQALRENLKRRKTGARKTGSGATDEAIERPAGQKAGKSPIDPRLRGGEAAVPENAARPNPAEKTS
jgi:hypothetical protein